MRFVKIAFLLFPFSLHAAGAILVDKESIGTPVVWKDGVIRYNLESDEAAKLGKNSHEEAVSLVRELFETWKGVTLNGIGTVSITLVEGKGLGSVDASNVSRHFAYCPPKQNCPDESPPFNLGSARTGDSPILFDDDGSMTDAVQGVGASKSILGFAGPRVVERVNGVLSILEGQAMLNGKFIDGIQNNSNPEVPLEDFRGAILHELGHFMGLDHSQVNLSSAVKFLAGDTSEGEAIPTMFPLFVNGKVQSTLHFDDKVAISLLNCAKACCATWRVAALAGGNADSKSCNLFCGSLLILYENFVTSYKKK